jgi:nicotinate dehydrogenase subunit A
MPVTITVNGQRRAVKSAPDTPLLYVLRDELGLNGAKFGCGLSQCGACTVLRDGRPLRACVAPVGQLQGAEITTLEGLGGGGGRLHALQTAFLEEQAGQCAYCIPGMIMTAAALLKAKPKPTPAEIRQALEGNLCRCGSHNRILRAVQRAASGAA